MSAPPFFQSAGRGDLLFWGEKEGPTVVIWESLSEQENKVSWKRRARCTTGSCGAGHKKGRRKSAHLSSAGMKSSLTMVKRNRKGKRTKRTGAKEGTSRAECMIQVMVGARQHQNGSERGSRFMLGSQRSHCHNKTNPGFVDSSEGIRRKGRMSSTTDRCRAGILDGHRDQ